MTSASPAVDPIMDRLEDQIVWYDRKSATSQRWSKRLKLTTLICAALVPALSFLPFGRYVAAALGVVIVVIEGLQQINQYQANWISYRATCEALRHEKYLYLAAAGPYAAAQNPRALLAERVESMVSQENAKWVTAQQEVAGKRADSVHAS